jgi:hypothetical protein
MAEQVKQKVWQEWQPFSEAELSDLEAGLEFRAAEPPGEDGPCGDVWAQFIFAAAGALATIHALRAELEAERGRREAVQGELRALCEELGIIHHGDIPGAFLDAAGAIPRQPGDEASEVTIRRLRDASDEQQQADDNSSVT